LSKDVAEVIRCPDVIVQITEIPSVASVTFLDSSSPASAASFVESLPSRFLIRVPRFYPHNGPVIQCLDSSCYPNDFFDENGNSTHPLFSSDWLAIYSLTNVIETLRQIRLVFGSSKVITRGSSGIEVCEMDEER
jgi:hypothetical protein